ncbi:hypothetical protein [Pseudonocardia abyssalis]|uniref:Uncharacterized protein n=1 Tax=Pseudonocardia abyssalis TaxID=2792008 RepID=A0ABS6UKZ2_9PSEU|nr:hypothetical protein [Pseudonocardia abyssalis]MBW0114912.1 hypothetical protein [Pseudonocardia abyssalis]MBW0132886.1 hypothetical protein [Pseudonocardia abyssalis]
MAPDSPDWTVPASLRALFWWPGVAFALALIAPEAAVGSIAVAGLVLVALGALAEAVGRRTRTAAPEVLDASTFQASEFEPAGRAVA